MPLSVSALSVSLLSLLSHGDGSGDELATNLRDAREQVAIRVRVSEARALFANPLSGLAAPAAGFREILGPPPALELGPIPPFLA